MFLSDAGHYQLHIIVIAVILLSGVSWLGMAIAGTFNIWLRIAVGIVGILSLVAMFNRDLYLPFLGSTVLPESLLVATTGGGVSQKPQPNSILIQLKNLPPNTKIIYWAAESSDPRDPTVLMWNNAYKDFANSGVVMSDVSGFATIMVRKPQEYKVSKFGFPMNIKPHIHYRYVLSKSMLSKIYTVYV
jgi:hypothetical protein